MNRNSIDKRSQWKSQMRRKQLQQQMQRMRQQCLMFNSEDYRLLKDVNLQELIIRFKENDEYYWLQNMQLLQKEIIFPLFLYGTKSDVDHLTNMLDEYCIEMMIGLVNWRNMNFFIERGRLYLMIWMIFKLL